MPAWDAVKKRGFSGRGEGTISDLGSETILKNMQDPPDAKRRKDLEALAAKARAGDASALERLHVLAALPGYEEKYGKGYGAGTRDSRNFARYLLERDFGEDLNYLSPGDKYAGDDLGAVLKVAAPILGATIPGVGLLGAAAIGAGGTAAGDYASRGRVDLKNALLAGTLSAAGNSILGNGLGSTNAALPGVPGTTAAATGPAGMGGSAASAAGASSVLGAAGKAKSFGDAISKYGPLILAGAGTIDAAGRHAQADQYRKQALDMAMQDYASRAGARDQAMGRVLAPLPTRPDLSAIYASPNPYARPVPRG